MLFHGNVSAVFKDARPPFWYYFYPPFAFYRSVCEFGSMCARVRRPLTQLQILLLGASCAIGECPQWKDFRISEHAAILIYMYLSLYVCVRARFMFIVFFYDFLLRV
jgi:hypothetical protein